MCGSVPGKAKPKTCQRLSLPGDRFFSSSMKVMSFLKRGRNFPRTRWADDKAKEKHHAVCFFWKFPFQTHLPVVNQRGRQILPSGLSSRACQTPQRGATPLQIHICCLISRWDFGTSQLPSQGSHKAWNYDLQATSTIVYNLDMSGRMAAVIQVINWEWSKSLDFTFLSCQGHFQELGKNTAKLQTCAFQAWVSS